MKIGVFAVLFGTKPFEETLDYIVDLGLGAVEIGTGAYPGNAHANPAALLASERRLKAFREADRAPRPRHQRAQLPRQPAAPARGHREGPPPRVRADGGTRRRSSASRPSSPSAGARGRTRRPSRPAGSCRRGRPSSRRRSSGSGANAWCRTGSRRRRSAARPASAWPSRCTRTSSSTTPRR